MVQAFNNSDPLIAFLDGIRLVTMAQNVPGPLAAARMREAGARVTKIEPPAGDPFLALSPAWHAEMHEGIAIERLDLKVAGGRARVAEILTGADIFLTSQRPSALGRLGLDPASLRDRHPQLRTVRILGSVHDPEQAGHDLTYQAVRGLIGDAMPRTITADIMASERAFAAMVSILRQPTGSVVDVGLVESLDPLLASIRHGLTTPNGTLGGGAYRYRLYATKSGTIAVAALEAHFETQLCEQLGLCATDDPTSHFLERTAADWETWARERDLPIVAVARGD